MLDIADGLSEIFSGGMYPAISTTADEKNGSHFQIITIALAFTESLGALVNRLHVSVSSSAWTTLEYVQNTQIRVCSFFADLTMRRGIYSPLVIFHTAAYRTGLQLVHECLPLTAPG